MGFRLGKGEALQHILDTLGSVAEGVETTKGLRNIVSKLDIEAPISEQVWMVLHGGSTVKVASEKLMHLPSMREHDGFN